MAQAGEGCSASEGGAIITTAACRASMTACPARVWEQRGAAAA